MTIVELAQYEELHNKLEVLVMAAWKKYVGEVYPGIDYCSFSNFWVDMDKPGIFVYWSYWNGEDERREYMQDLLPLESVTLKQP